MIDEKSKELINLAIDGELSPEDEMELQAYLRQNKEAEIIYKDLLQTSKILNQMPDVDPPLVLKRRILDAVDYSLYTRETKESRIKSFMYNWLVTPRAKLAYAFVLGVFLSALVFTPVFINISQRQDIDTSHLSGTIKTFEDTALRIINTIPVNLHGMSGEIILRKYQHTVTIEFDLNTADEFEILLIHDPNQIRLDHLKPMMHSKTSLDYGADYLKIRNSGDIKTSLYFTQSSPKVGIELSLSRAGITVLDQTLLLE